MLTSRYIKKGGNRYDITRESNRKYNIMYYPKTSPSFDGSYDTLKAAEETIEKSRPTALKLNSICINCKADCNGTTEQVWTGCVYRK